MNFLNHFSRYLEILNAQRFKETQNYNASTKKHMEESTIIFWKANEGWRRSQESGLK